MERKTDLLLKEIQGFAQCAYLSDLHAAALDQRAKDLILKIPDSCYTVPEWSMAVAYITNLQRDFQTVREAKEALALTM